MGNMFDLIVRGLWGVNPKMLEIALFARGNPLASHLGRSRQEKYYFFIVYYIAI